jgi:hypothetical protein
MATRLVVPDDLCRTGREGEGALPAHDPGSIDVKLDSQRIRQISNPPGGRS